MDNYKLLLEKFWSGTASETEKLQLYKTILKDEEAIKADVLQETASEKEERLSPEVSQSILESLHREIGARASQSIERPRKSWGLFRWAAALLVIGIASSITWNLYRVKDNAGHNTALPPVLAVIDNKGKDIKLVALDDGTTIELYPGSALRLQQPFKAQRIRGVQLTGKANFKVKHDAARPFEVIANDIRTRDIGTEFCIDAPDRHTFRVALKEGSIQVEAMPNSGISMEAMILKPGEELHWDPAGQRMIRTAMARQPGPEPRVPAAAAAVSKDRLVFEKTPLDKVFSKLAQRASIPIRYKAEEIKALTFTGTIEPSDNIETALTIICKLNGLEYQKEQQGFIIAKHQ